MIPNRISELKTLPMKRKGDWEGMGWLMAALVWLGRLTPFALLATSIAMAIARSMGVQVSSTLAITVAVLALMTLPFFFIARKFMKSYSTSWFGVLWYAQNFKNAEGLGFNKLSKP